MTEEILTVMREEIRTTVDRAVPPAIEKHVNGGVRKIQAMLEDQNRKQEEFNHKVDTHMAKVEPYLTAYEGIRTAGAGTMFWAGVLAAVSASFFYIKGILK